MTGSVRATSRTYRDEPASVALWPHDRERSLGCALVRVARPIDRDHTERVPATRGEPLRADAVRRGTRDVVLPVEFASERRVRLGGREAEGRAPALRHPA